MRLIKHPVLCNYYLTYRCNASCSFCDIWEKPSPYITIEDFKNNLIDLKRLGVKVIDFTGGEPLLHRDLPQFLALAKEMKFITTVTTNCLLYPKSAEKLKGLIDMLHFSLDSADSVTHNKMRNVECFEFVMESIKIAKNLGERPDIIFTVFEDNFEEIEKVYWQICVPNDLVLILNPAFSYNQISTNNLSESQLNELKKWAKKPLVYLNEAFIQLRVDGGNDIENPVCKAGSSTIVISPNNELVLPCYHLGMKNIPINNNLYQLHKSNEVQQLISQEGKLKECQSCTINCYMQPSFAVELNKYWFLALPSTFKYNVMKGTWKNIFK